MINADKTPIWHELVGDRTVNQVSVRDVAIKCGGAEKVCFTVMLAVTADGQKLPPMLI